MTLRGRRGPGDQRGADPDHADPVLDRRRAAPRQIDVFNNPGGLNDIVLGVVGPAVQLRPGRGHRDDHRRRIDARRCRSRPASPSPRRRSYGYVIGIDDGRVHRQRRPTFPLLRLDHAAPRRSYPLMTAPQMFTLGGNFYTFDQDASGAYVSVTGNRQIHPGQPVPVLDQRRGLHHQHERAAQHGRSAAATSPDDRGQHAVRAQRRAVHDHAEGRIAQRRDRLRPVQHHAGQRRRHRELRLPARHAQRPDRRQRRQRTRSRRPGSPTRSRPTDRQLHGHDRSRTRPRSRSANIVYQINNTTVVGDGVVYPILVYRTLRRRRRRRSTSASTARARLPATFPLSGSAPFTGATFTDGARPTRSTTSPPSTARRTSGCPGSPPQFTAGGRTYTLRTDGVSIAAGPAKTYLGPTTGAAEPEPVHLRHRRRSSSAAPTDIAAFDGTHYYADREQPVHRHEYRAHLHPRAATPRSTRATATRSSATSARAPYFEVPGGPTYYVNIPVADTGTASGDIFTVFPVTRGRIHDPAASTRSPSPAASATVDGSRYPRRPDRSPRLPRPATSLTGGYFIDPVTGITYTVRRRRAPGHLRRLEQRRLPLPRAGRRRQHHASVVVVDRRCSSPSTTTDAAVFPVAQQPVHRRRTATYTVERADRLRNARRPVLADGERALHRAAAPRPMSNLAYTVAGGTARSRATSSPPTTSSPSTATSSTPSTRSTSSRRRDHRR